MCRNHSYKLQTASDWSGIFLQPRNLKSTPGMWSVMVFLLCCLCPCALKRRPHKRLLNESMHRCKKTSPVFSLLYSFFIIQLKAALCLFLCLRMLHLFSPSALEWCLNREGRVASSHVTFLPAATKEMHADVHVHVHAQPAQAGRPCLHGLMSVSSYLLWSLIPPGPQSKPRLC